jgi:hypothetical protein
MFLSYTAISKIIDNGDIIDYCPRKLYWTVVNPIYQIQKQVFLEGNYFESQCIDYGRDRKVIDDLPRHKVTGRKLITQKRIDHQVLSFKKQASQRNVIHNEINTQISFYFTWDQDEKIIIRSTPDIILTPFISDQHGEILATIDLKLTGDLNNDFGPYQWKEPIRRDLTQGILYSYGLLHRINFELNDKYNPKNELRQLFTENVKELLDSGVYQFIYWIFDKKEPLTSKIVPLEYDMEKKKFLDETIRKTIEIYREIHRMNYPTNPKYSLCRDCPIAHKCKDYTNTQEPI